MSDLVTPRTLSGFRDYLPSLIEKAGQGAFDAQCIPTDGALLLVENYKGFLSKRREAVAQRLNAFLGSPP